MDLGQSTRCICITLALLIIIVGRTAGNGNGISIGSACATEIASDNLSQSLTLNTVYYNHRVLFLTVLGTLALTLLGCLGCLCCCCCCSFRWSTRNVESLDAYAPRTQSIVWPPLPEETAHVLELTFLHTPGAVDCLCSACELAKKCVGTSQGKQLQNQYRENMEMLLMFLLLAAYPELNHASNYSDNYWFNETQFVQEDDDNATATINNSGGYRIISDISESNNSIVAAPVDPLMRVAFVALLLHILIVAGGIIIYSVVYCKHRAAKRRPLEVKQRLQSPLTLRHVPNIPNCRCHGCLVARQMLSGLIVQSIIKERAASAQAQNES
ncbi:hypothetical protein ACLKA7_000291 [Drosophila subpalustris]